jgi:hypothetical protein
MSICHVVRHTLNKSFWSSVGLLKNDIHRHMPIDRIENNSAHEKINPKYGDILTTPLLLSIIFYFLI